MDVTFIRYFMVVPDVSDLCTLGYSDFFRLTVRQVVFGLGEDFRGGFFYILSGSYLKSAFVV